MPAHDYFWIIRLCDVCFWLSSSVSPVPYDG
jgi:hypothetical protein